jgi:hypothetical protein
MLCRTILVTADPTHACVAWIAPANRPRAPIGLANLLRSPRRGFQKSCPWLSLCPLPQCNSSRAVNHWFGVTTGWSWQRYSALRLSTEAILMRRYPEPHFGQMMPDVRIPAVCSVSGRLSSRGGCEETKRPPEGGLSQVIKSDVSRGVERGDGNQRTRRALMALGGAFPCPIERSLSQDVCRW